MGLGWYLLKRSYRQHAARLWLIVAAVAIGVALLLSMLAGVNGLFHRGNHDVWRTAVTDTKYQQPRPGIAPLLMQQGTMGGDLNMWQNETIRVASVRATGATSPQIPGIHTPGPNEYYASPRLASLIKSQPTNLLADRFQGKMVGTMPDSLVNSPDSLDIVRGMSEQEAQVAQSHNSGITSVYEVPGGTVNPYNGFLLVMLIIGALGLLFPVVKFMASATRLGSLQREQRYAALRLVGATKRQVRAIAAVESMCTTLAGIMLGTAIFWLVLPLLEGFRFGGERFYASEMQITMPQYLIIVTLTLSAAFTANWWGMRRVQNSPLGVVRTQRQKGVPHWLRLVPLGLGVACLVVIQTVGKVTLHKMVRDGSSFPFLLFFAAFIFIVVGLMIAGPVLTRMTAALVARYSRQAPSIIATKRIAALSRQTFAGVSGVVLALFVGTFYITATSGVSKLSAEALGNNGYSQLHANVILVGLGSMGQYDNRQIQREIKELPNIAKVVALSDKQDQLAIAISCQDAAYFTTIRCTRPSGWIGVDLGGKVLNAPVGTYLATSDISTQSNVLLVATTDSSDVALERIRSIMSQTGGSLSYGTGYVVSGKYAQKPVISPIIEELAGLAYAGIAITMLIAAGGLIVSTISGLLERKRSLLTLRLSGMTVRQLKRLVQIESVVPLIAASIVSAALGVEVAKTFMNIASSTLTTALPDWRYYAIIATCLALAFAGITGVLAGLDRMTGFEDNRAE